MLRPDVQQIVRDLQRALGIEVTVGKVTLNVNQGRLESVTTETYQRIERQSVDAKPLTRA